MSVKATYDYQGEPLDGEEKFHGKQLVYIGWDKHLMFCAPLALPLPPDTPFQALVQEIFPGLYGSHPDWAQVKWEEVEWMLDGEAFSPKMPQGLREQGVGHKSIIRFRTPGLDGILGSAS